MKMILELSQMLSTAHRVLDGLPYYEKSAKGRAIKRYHIPYNEQYENDLYKATHINHPCNIWVRKSRLNYEYTYHLLAALHDEYTYRYGKIHKSKQILEHLRAIPLHIPENGWTQPPQAMPEDVQHSDSVTAYRQYYIKYKSHLAEWKKREVPEWYKGALNG